MSNQEWSPFAEESPPSRRPSPGPGRASVPPSVTASPPRAQPSPYTPPSEPFTAGAAVAPPTSGPSAGPVAGKAAVAPPTDSGAAPFGSEAPHDQTAPLRPPSAAKKSAPSLIPAPDATAILPQIPDEEIPAPAGADSATRKKQSVKRHRGAVATGVRRTVRGVGETLITFGVIVLLYAAYEVFGVSGEINDNQESLSSELDIAWQQNEEAVAEESVDGAPIPELGDAFARMWAPDIRPESWTLVEGTELSDIEYAPGRHLDGAYPGEQGNFTLAGHNVPAIFQKIRDLEPGDKVVIETKEYFYVYEVQEHVVVDETQVEILTPVPRQPGVAPGPDDYWLTMFTCHPLWDNYERYVVFSQLTETYERDPEGELPDEAINPEA
ncbi:hypothetical protein GCM10027447_16250 [Glycomyces halotolerans]